MTNTQALRQINGHTMTVVLSPLAQVLSSAHSASCACVTGNQGI